MRLRIVRDNYIQNTGQPAIRTSIDEYDEEGGFWTVTDIGVHLTLEDADLWLATVTPKAAVQLAVGSTIEIEI